MKPTDFAYSLTSYLSKYLPGEVGASSNTIQSYRDTFSLLIKYCASEKSILTEKLTLHQLDRKLIEDLLNWLEEEENVVSQRESEACGYTCLFQVPTVGATACVVSIPADPCNTDEKGPDVNPQMN